jgi:selenocysteine lyase/cysteine desulfurase
MQPLSSALPVGSPESNQQRIEPPGLADLRQQFPILERHAYLNAGTDGPLPAAAVQAAAAELQRETRDGRTPAHFEHRRELEATLRASYADLLGCKGDEVALTTCTSEGVSLVVAGLALGPGEEILTSRDEHPGLLGALQTARELTGVSIRAVALEELPRSLAANTRLIACSHVSWVDGSIAPATLAEVSEEVPVLFDGAQGVGAVPLDVHALGADAYAGSGQKWLCGPDGLGMLYVSPRLHERLRVTRRGYSNLEDPDAGLAARLHPDARRFDCFALSAEALACALASLRVLADAGWSEVHTRARLLAERLAARLSDRGRDIAPRGPTTLVSFSSADPPGERLRLAGRGVLVRDIPNRALLRASVGAWNDESDLDRLVRALDPAGAVDGSG